MKACLQWLAVGPKALLTPRYGVLKRDGTDGRMELERADTTLFQPLEDWVEFLHRNRWADSFPNDALLLEDGTCIPMRMLL